MNVERFNEHKKDEPEPVWWELSGNTGWLLYNSYAPFGIKAVGEDLCVTDLGIYIAMRVPVNPIIYTGISNIVTQLHRKGPIDSASFELGRSA